MLKPYICSVSFLVLGSWLDSHLGSNEDDSVLVYRLSMRAFLMCTDDCRAAPVLYAHELCVFLGLRSILHSIIVLTIVHLDGTPILSLHNISLESLN